MKSIRVIAFISVLILGLGLSSALAGQSKFKTVATLYKERTALAGQTVQVRGTVVKANNNILGRNFVHVQDGTGAKGTNDLTVTSSQTARVGDKVVITGRVVVDKDFGYGYVYPLLVERASILPAQ